MSAADPDSALEGWHIKAGCHPSRHTSPTGEVLSLAGFLGPFALSFFEKVRVVVAWCELREDYRHFRTDRIVVLNMTEKRYPRRRQAMLKEWRERELTKEASER